jgi:hypothetical protein
VEKKTAKTHLEFDIPAANALYGGLQTKLSGEQITSPFDLFSVERLRDKHDLRKGQALPTDVFVFGKGKPALRQTTKVSGLPYWPKNRDWPEADEGGPCQFLAQFNFSDSRELVPDLPGEILLIFVPLDNEDWLWEDELIRFEWLDINSGGLMEGLPAGVKPYSDSEWYGAICRSHDYPESVQTVQELEIDQAYDLPIVNGTKIGGLPSGIQTEADFEIDSDSGLPMFRDDESGAFCRHFLAQLTSIQAHPDVEYPWTNQKKKLNLGFNAAGIYGKGNSCVFGDMGSIYIFIDVDGQCVATSESY